MISISYRCSVCRRQVFEARVWDDRAICHDCTFRPVGTCPICNEMVNATITPLQNERTHCSIAHTCNVAKGGDA